MKFQSCSIHPFPVPPALRSRVISPSIQRPSNLVCAAMSSLKIFQSINRNRFNISFKRHLTSKLIHQASQDALEQACNAFIIRYKPTPRIGPSQEDKLESKLADITVAIKDIFCIKGSITSCASLMLKDFKSPYDAQVVMRLKKHGALIVGKTNMDEFSMGSASVYSTFGPVVNPHGFCKERKVMIQRRSAGGSSGGSAAAVAGKFCDVAIGSDTGGSIRLPAAYCGVIGLKPSYGLISRHGMVQYSNSLDTVGILSNSTELIQRTFACLEGYDKHDPTSVSMKTRAQSSQLNQLWQDHYGLNSMDLSNLRVGVPVEYFTSDISEEVLNAFRSTVAFFRKNGAQVISVSLPSTANCLGAYYVIASAEASSNLAKYSGVHYGHRSIVDLPSQASKSASPRSLYVATRTEGLGPEVKRRLLLGAYCLSASGMKNYFLQAQRIRLQIGEEFDRVFRWPNPLSTTSTTFSSKGVDVLLTPPALSIAPPLSEVENKDAKIVANWSQDRLLVPTSLAGLPAIVVPVGNETIGSCKWPLSVQIIGQWGSESILFQVARALEAIET
ncbi:hypothetical protein O181_016087 [Austropuccinia psidii MF-1]|uniref:Glutamyl-tRNA(Gln) amidotransferase subunit A, mitochondrial n=1 Tax=Austropuccinia psidii MF-1 TaxID=1389203 RepID=A0A9Q3C4X4_9BASI|nr:hypothetical protein [Austropuccinia psidii MF-1]